MFEIFFWRAKCAALNLKVLEREDSWGAEKWLMKEKIASLEKNCPPMNYNRPPLKFQLRSNHSGGRIIYLKFGATQESNRPLVAICLVYAAVAARGRRRVSVGYIFFG